MLIKISEIVVGDRLRQSDAGKVAELAESIKALGLLQPIVVGTDKRLIAGKHRLEAARRLGWESIECTLLTLDPLNSELAEIDENLRRNELTILEQSQHLTRRDPNT